MITVAMEKPWETIDLGEDAAGAIPSMICPDERRYLYWLAREYYSGRGVIVDAGPLLGSSTAMLAQGLRQNSRGAGKTGRIHSYDQFQYQPYMRWLFEGEAEPATGESVLPHFLSHIEPWRELVEVHPGDLKQFAWTGGPIEIVFIDLAKDWALQTHLLREFFPALIPGVSIVVQQDYFHHRCHWITLVMEHLADYFTPVHMPGGATLGFALVEEIPPSLLHRDYEHFFSQPEAEALFTCAAGRFTGTHRLRTMTARVSMLLDYGDIATALAVLEMIRRSPGYDATVAADFVSVARRVKTLVTAASAPAVLSPSMRDEFVRRLDTLIDDVRPWDAPPARGESALQLMSRAAHWGRPLYLWGAGQGGRDLLRTLRARRVPVAGFLDRDPGKTGTRVDEVTVSAPTALDPVRQPRPFVGISSIFADEIIADLTAGGWARNVDYAVL